jgi:hypothetical protein
MEGGRYRVDLEVAPRIPVRDLDIRDGIERLKVYLPDNAQITYHHADWDANTIGGRRDAHVAVACRSHQ